MSENTKETIFKRQISDFQSHQNLRTLSAGLTVREAARIMAENQIGAVVVVDGNNLKGVFTERDLLVKVVDQGLDPDATKLAKVMTSDTVLIPQDADVLTAMFMMRDHGTRHLLIEADDVVIGILSVRDLLRTFVEDAMVDELDLDELWASIPY